MAIQLSGDVQCRGEPAGTAGKTIGPRDHKMGQFGAWTADVYLDDVRVPAEALVGGDEGLHQGFVTAAKCLAHGRAHIAALCVGMAGRLVQESIDFATTREQGGKTIASLQLIQGLVADSVTDPAIRAEIEKGGETIGIAPAAIARAIAFAIEQPEDVDVGEIVVRPTVQR